MQTVAMLGFLAQGSEPSVVINEPGVPATHLGEDTYTEVTLDDGRAELDNLGLHSSGFTLLHEPTSVNLGSESGVDAYVPGVATSD